MLKHILRQRVDLLLFAATAGLLITHFVSGADVSGMLLLLLGYISFEVLNKSKLAYMVERGTVVFIKQPA